MPVAHCDRESARMKWRFWIFSLAGVFALWIGLCLLISYATRGYVLENDAFAFVHDLTSFAARHRRTPISHSELKNWDRANGISPVRLMSGRWLLMRVAWSIPEVDLDERVAIFSSDDPDLAKLAGRLNREFYGNYQAVLDRGVGK
jgi:hypothetical protein